MKYMRTMMNGIQSGLSIMFQRETSAATKSGSPYGGGKVPVHHMLFTAIIRDFLDWSLPAIHLLSSTQS